MARFFYDFEMGETTYRVGMKAGYTYIYDIVRPLPPLLPNGRRHDWEAEHQSLQDNIRANMAKLGETLHYDPVFDMPTATARVKCRTLIRRYYKYVDSLPSEAFDAKPKHPMAGQWSIKQWQEERLRGIEETKDPDFLPSRLRHIGTTDLLTLPEARKVYKDLKYRADNYKINVYQCACGRLLAVPKRFGKPTRANGSCGCGGSGQPIPIARNAAERRLDAFREWTTIKLSCSDNRSVYCDTATGFSLPSWRDFYEWYDERVKGMPTTKRFVARIDKTKPFRLDNLRFIDCRYDRVPRFGYTDL